MKNIRKTFVKFYVHMNVAWKGRVTGVYKLVVKIVG